MSEEDLILKMIQTETEHGLRKAAANITKGAKEFDELLMRMSGCSEDELDSLKQEIQKTQPCCMCNWKYESCHICNPNGGWKVVWG